MDYTQFKEEIDHDLNTQTMEKVYRIYEHIYEDNYTPSEEHTLGIFTDKSVADDIVSKLKSIKENKLAERDHDYSYEAQQLETTYYNVEELIINKLYN